jgi:hypothetical protein
MEHSICGQTSLERSKDSTHSAILRFACLRPITRRKSASHSFGKSKLPGVHCPDVTRQADAKSHSASWHTAIDTWTAFPRSFCLFRAPLVDDAMEKLCGARFAFSRSGDLRLFERLDCGRYGIRVHGRCGFA